MFPKNATLLFITFSILKSFCIVVSPSVTVYIGQFNPVFKYVGFVPELYNPSEAITIAPIFLLAQVD